MGLDTSHGCWHGAYSAFMRWRTEIARVAGMPPLELMEGFYQPLQSRSGEYLSNIDRLLPIRWNALKPSALHKLLFHSDCDGQILWEDCGSIADELEKLLPKFPPSDGGGHIGNWRDKTQTFIDGLRLAASKQENVDFH